MVKLKFFACFLISLFAFKCVANPVQISVDIDGQLASENQPIQGMIIVSHDPKDKVDESTFEMQGKPLKVKKIQQSQKGAITIQNGKMSQKVMVLEGYAFEVEPQKKGRHQLSPIKVKVGSSFYQSHPSWYEVLGAEKSDRFILKEEIKAPKALYPGQRFTATYRLFYQGNIEPIQEHFPLLHAKGCTKIGERKIHQYKRGQTKIIEISQLLEAKEIGEHQIESGFVEGFEFQEDFFLHRVYKKPKLRAQSKPFTLQILEYPKEIKSETFSGAVGSFEVDVELLSSPKVALGDKIQLKLTFKGQGLETLKLPNLALQKEFKNKFKFNDLPSLGQTLTHQKTFHVELRPMQEDLCEIPPMEFTYFDPDTQKYKTITTPKVPIEVTQLERPKFEAVQKETPKIEEPSEEQEVITDKELSKAIEIHGLLPVDALKTSKPFSLKHYTHLLLFASLLLALQAILKKRGLSKREYKSYHLLQAAFQHEKEPQKFLVLVDKAFKERLKERGWMKEESHFEDLSSEGINGEIKEFMHLLQVQLFSKGAQFDFHLLKQKAQKLYKKMGETP